MTFSVFFRNNEIVPIDQATIPLSYLAYQYGFGVYESIKVRNGIVYFVEQHSERLLQSAKITGLEHEFAKEKIKKSIENLVSILGEQQSQIPQPPFVKGVSRKTGDFSCNLKILLIGGKRKEDALLFILPLAPLFPDRKLYSEGAKTITVQYERLFPNAKTLNMLGSFLAYKKAKEQNCYDALLINAHTNILEGTRTNFFAVKDKTIFTPPAQYILEGVTRQTVLFVAKKYGFTIEAWDIALKQIKEGEYEGAFLTSTSSKIVPIKQIDDYIFPTIPEAMKELMTLYDEFLEESGGVFG